MKILKSSLLLVITLLFFSCKQNSYLVQQYSHEFIQNTKDGEFYKSRHIILSNNSSTKYIAYLSNSEKYFIMIKKSYSRARKMYKDDFTILEKSNIIHLNTEECQRIINNYDELKNRYLQEKPAINEIIYHEFKVNKDLVLSYRKHVNKNSKFPELDIWVRGVRYSISRKEFINSIEKFLTL